EDLEFLDLDNTQVRDLRPLLEFASAREKDGNRSLDALHFRNTPALALDDTLRELSKVEDVPERTAKTLAYLAEVRDDWPPLPAKSITQDTILTVIQTEDGRLDVAPSQPDADELEDMVKAKAHEKLQDAAKALEQVAGNYHPRLASTARTLSDHIKGDMKTLDMLDVHFELEALRGTYERRAERIGENIFDDDVVDALDRVLMVGPGLVLDNAEVEKLEARKDRYRGAPPSRDVQHAQDVLSDGIIKDQALFGDNMRGYSNTFRKGRVESSDRLRTGQGVLNKNTVIKVGTATGLFIAAGMAGGPLSELGNYSLAWLVAHSETIATLAATWGESFLVWITPIMMRAREAQAAIEAKIQKGDQS
ncbi:MAG: hypothetical protein GY947_15775, partial [Rhodobacteraceae bacterium]|nr:hypothetical protein [Paracoccaceae bacterium]